LFAKDAWGGNRLPFTDTAADEEPAPEESGPEFSFDIDESASVFKTAGEDDNGADASLEESVADLSEFLPANDLPEALPTAASLPPDDEDTHIVALPPSADDGQVLIRGVDLNQASEAELIEQLEGIGTRLAARIVRFRERHNGFTSVDDLTRVPGVGPSTFERLTGSSWSEARDSVRRTLNYLFGTNESAMPDLDEVAKRFKDLPGFKGCLITHEEGHLMAASWDHENQEMLGAMAPQMFKKVTHYMEPLGMGEVNPLTLFLGDDAVTIVESGDLFLALIHDTSRLNKRQINLVQLAGAELENRLDKVKDAI
jgi:competence ComEA-like helix-hairpin-helix protein